MMRKVIRKLLPKGLELKIVGSSLNKILDSCKILCVDYNHFNNIRKKTCENKHGMPIPWYTYPSIEYLSQIDFNNKIVFEWSCGNSSLWWAERAKKVFSVEHNEQWYDRIMAKKKSNQEIVLTAIKEEYVNAIKVGGTKYDVITIDGVYRESCTKIALEYLKPGGMIIFDNSDWYPLSCSYLRELGLIQVDFFGFGPMVNFTTATSVFIHRDFDMKTKNKNQPGPHIGGIINNSEIESPYSTHEGKI